MTIEKAILRSKQDRSINFVDPTDDGGALECRFVQRTDDTIIVYLSSASGCDKACRFCHLTQTAQTMMTHVDVDGYYRQAAEIFSLLVAENKLAGVKIVHYNFMARGDALANPHFVQNTDLVIDRLGSLARHHELIPKFKVSTIFPRSDLFDTNYQQLKDWVARTLTLDPEIEFYYSLYSLDFHFRKRWIPKAISPSIVGEAFSNTREKLRLHYALILGENITTHDAFQIRQWLSQYNISCRFNVVRYNPFSEACGEEAPMDMIVRYKDLMEESPFIVGTSIISRVGRDVAASCGTFVS